MNTVAEEGKYVHVFVYRIPKKKHDDLLAVQAKLAKIYMKHGMLGSRTYQLGTTNVFEGFQGFENALSASSGEEVWLETDFYQNRQEFGRIVAAIGNDETAGPLWGELPQITGERQVVMGEFAQLAKA